MKRLRKGKEKDKVDKAVPVSVCPKKDILVSIGKTCRQAVRLSERQIDRQADIKIDRRTEK